MSQRIKSYNKEEVEETIKYYEGQGLQVIKKGRSCINKDTTLHWAILK